MNSKSLGHSVPFNSLDERLDNWRRTVLLSPYRDVASSWWADMYVRMRDSRSAMKPPNIPRYDLDGWMVEEAWKHLPNHVNKWVLKYHFVMNMGKEQVQTRLWRVHKVRLRGPQFEMALENARHALAREINVLSNNRVEEYFLFEACVA